jgi:uncharacterized protein
MRRRNPPLAVAPWTPANGGNAAPARDLSVVHSSLGRLRVHLPHWSGCGEAEIAAEVRGLAGVTHAEASPITGNLLILFASRQTSADALLKALPALRMQLPDQPSVLAPPPSALTPVAAPLALFVDTPEPAAEPEGYYMTGAARVLYQILGWSSVGLAVVGAIIPGIPTAPFVVLAGYFFIRSSPEAHQWLRQSRWFGPILRDWEDHRAVRRSIRNAAVGLILAGMSVTAILGLPATLTATIITLQLLGLVIVMSLPVIEPAELGDALPASAK